VGKFKLAPEASVPASAALKRASVDDDRKPGGAGGATTTTNSGMSASTFTTSNATMPRNDSAQMALDEQFASASRFEPSESSDSVRRDDDDDFDDERRDDDDDDSDDDDDDDDATPVPAINYPPGVWRPDTQSGKREYPREFLLQFQPYLRGAHAPPGVPADVLLPYEQHPRDVRAVCDVIAVIAHNRAG
jgi:hypothetical protein